MVDQTEAAVSAIRVWRTIIKFSEIFLERKKQNLVAANHGES